MIEKLYTLLSNVHIYLIVTIDAEKFEPNRKFCCAGLMHKTIQNEMRSEQ